jgi:hypothetical protein
MTAQDLVVWLADEFHDWIDGDDAVRRYNTTPGTVYVEFESGSMFEIRVKQTNG